MDKCKVGLIGIGGFGKFHIDVIKKLARQGRLELVAFADPYITDYETYESLIASGVKYYQDYMDMLAQHLDISIVSICTPIHLHKRMAISTMEKGFNVFVEKPPAATIQDMDAMIFAQEKYGVLCGVNFQNTSGKAFRMLIRKLREGVLGDIRSVSGVGMWKRTNDYYERNDWAGKLILGGSYILDGTINNPFAHLVNNCLITAGCGDVVNLGLKSVQAELYKGHDIEGEDTACIRILTADGIEIRIYTTLCHTENALPYIRVEGTDGTALWKYDNTLQIIKGNGTKEEYRYEDEDLMMNMYRNFIDVLEGKEKELYSPLKACRNFVLSVNGAFESAKSTVKIPDSYLTICRENNTQAVYIDNIATVIDRAFREGKLLSEIPLEWSVKTDEFTLSNYRAFGRIF